MTTHLILPRTSTELTFDKFRFFICRLQLKLARGEHGYYLLHTELIKPLQPHVLVKEVTKEVALFNIIFKI